MKEGYKQSEIGVIPEEWEIRFLPYFGDVLSGGTPNTNVNDYWNGNIAWCTPSDITATSGTTITKTEKCITELGLSKSSATLLPSGSLLLCTRATIGDSKINAIPMATNQGFKNVVPKNCDIRFLYYLLQTKKKEMLEKAIGSTFLEISKSALCSIPLQYPKISEQQRIAEALSDMDELIASLEKLIAKKKAIKQGAMQELLTGKRRLPGFSGEWKAATWKEVLDGFISGATPYRGNSDYYKGEIKWVSSGELKYNHITDTIEHISKTALKESNLKIHPSGTFLMAITGLEAAGTRGSCAMLDVPATTNQSCMAIYSTEKMSALFLYYYYLRNGNELAFQYCQGTKQQSYTATIVKELPIWYPIDIQEQNAIAAYLADIDYEVDLLEQKAAKTRQIKQGMMQQLLTGKIRLA